VPDGRPGSDALEHFRRRPGDCQSAYDDRGIDDGSHAPEVASRAATLDHTDPKVTRLAVLEELVPRLHQLGGGPVLTPAEQAAYRRYDWLAGRDVVGPVAGRVVGVDVDGALLVESARGRERVLAGTVAVAM